MHPGYGQQARHSGWVGVYEEKTIEVFQAACEATRAAPLRGAVSVGHAGAPSGQGPYIQVHLAVADGRVEDATVKTYGCPACIACSQAVCTLAKGRSLSEAERITPADLVAVVGELPRAKRHCYGLALEAAHDALAKARAGHSSGATQLLEEA